MTILNLSFLFNKMGTIILPSLRIVQYKGAVPQRAYELNACSLIVLRDPVSLAASKESQVRDFIIYIGPQIPQALSAWLCAQLCNRKYGRLGKALNSQWG